MHCMQPALHDGQLLEGPWRFKLTIAMAVPGAIMMIAMMGEEARVTNFFSLKFDVGHGGVVAHVTKKFTTQFLNLLAIPAPTQWHPPAMMLP